MTDCPSHMTVFTIIILSWAKLNLSCLGLNKKFTSLIYLVYWRLFSCVLQLNSWTLVLGSPLGKMAFQNLSEIYCLFFSPLINLKLIEQQWRACVIINFGNAIVVGWSIVYYSISLWDFANLVQYSHSVYNLDARNLIYAYTSHTVIQNNCI